MAACHEAPRLRLTCCRQMVRFCVALLVAAAAAPTAAAGKPPTVWTPCNASAGICFSRNLGSNMVLQQAPAKACLFGMLGAGGTSATVKISTSQDVAAEVTARVAADGRWKACLPPQQAGGEFRITATCTGCAHPNAAVTIENVVFGDVYYCSGQSNMALPLVHTYSRNETRDAILAGKYANIRIQGLAGNMNADQEWATLKQALVARSCKGTNCKQGTDSDSSSLMSFSATCFYFGQELSGLLGAKAPPIGLVHTAWGGSTIEQWLTNSTIDTCEFSKKSAASQEFHDTRVLPYVDMTLKGFVWYQVGLSVLSAICPCPHICCSCSQWDLTLLLLLGLPAHHVSCRGRTIATQSWATRRPRQATRARCRRWLHSGGSSGVPARAPPTPWHRSAL